MKKIITLLLVLTFIFNWDRLQAQATFTPTGNTHYVGLDKNLLFNAKAHRTVTQTGTRSFNLESLFDGNFNVQYLAGFNGNVANNVVVEISGLPEYHTQIGAYVGFTTRYYPPKAFKIEGFDTYNGYNNWRTIADVSNHNGNSIFSAAVPSGAYTKLRFTFSNSLVTSGSDIGMIGLSELFFVHNEVAKSYDGLMVQYSPNGSVGIGTETPNTNYKLNVNGKIRAQEVKVETANWPDYVFETQYHLMPLQELEIFINKNKHLPEMPNAKQLEANGVELGDMVKLQQKKIEELTLYLIEKNKELDKERDRITVLEALVKEMLKKN